MDASIHDQNVCRRTSAFLSTGRSWLVTNLGAWDGLYQSLKATGFRLGETAPDSLAEPSDARRSRCGRHSRANHPNPEFSPSYNVVRYQRSICRASLLEPSPGPRESACSI